MRYLTARFEADLPASAAAVDLVGQGGIAVTTLTDGGLKVEDDVRVIGASAMMNIDSAVYVVANLESLRHAIQVATVTITIGKDVVAQFPLDELLDTLIESDGTRLVFSFGSEFRAMDWTLRAGQTIRVRVTRSAAAAVALQGVSVRLRFVD